MRISLKTAALTATLLGMGAWVIADAVEDKSTVRAAPDRPTTAASVRATTTEPQGEQSTFALPERALAESRAPLFSSHSWQPPPPKVVARPAPPPPPTAPPVPFRFVGRMLQDGHVSLFLANGDAVLTAKQGDTIQGVYQVESVGENEIAVIYMPLKQRQTIAVVSSLPSALSPPVPGAPADGPAGRAPAGVGSTSAPAPARASAPIPTSNIIAPAAAPPAAGSPPGGAPAQLHSREGKAGRG